MPVGILLAVQNCFQIICQKRVPLLNVASQHPCGTLPDQTVFQQLPLISTQSVNASRSLLALQALFSLFAAADRQFEVPEQICRSP